jgi:hypothetical protein
MPAFKVKHDPVKKLWVVFYGNKKVREFKSKTDLEDWLDFQENN